MSESTVIKSKVFVEDIALATGGTGAVETGTRLTSTGGTVTLSKLDASHIYYRDYAVPIENSATGDYVASTRAEIDAHLTTIGSSQATIRLLPGTITSNTDLTVPANVTLKAERGAILTASAGTITINGSLEAGLYQIFSCTGSGEVQFGSGVIRRIYPQWWGAVADWNGTTGTDNSPYFQAAIDSFKGPFPSRLLGGMIVTIPDGHYKLNTCLNLTTSEASGHNHRGIRVEGAGVYSTVLVGNTGKAVIDCSGSAFIKLTDFTIAAGTTNAIGDNPSTVGILYLLGAEPGAAYPNTENHIGTFSDIVIDVGTSATGESGVGTVGIYHQAAEEHNFHNLFVKANFPLVIATTTSINSSAFPGAIALTSEYIATGSTHGNTHYAITGRTSLVAYDSRGPALYLQEVYGLTTDQVYLARVLTGGAVGTYTNAVCIVANLSGARLNLITEQFSNMLHLYSGRIINSDINMSSASTIIALASTVLFEGVYAGGEVAAIMNSTLAMHDRESGTAPFFAYSLINSGNERQPASVINSRIRTTGGLSTILNPYVLYTTSGSTFEAVGVLRTWDEGTPDPVETDENWYGFLYYADGRTHKVSVPNTYLGKNASSKLDGEILTVVMPALITGNVDGGSCRIQLNGTLSNAMQQTNPAYRGDTLWISEAPLDIDFSILSKGDGTLTVSSPAVTMGTSKDLDAGVFSFASCAASTAVASREVTLTVTPTVSGTDIAVLPVYFVGTVTITWNGFRSQAPMVLPIQ